MIEKNKIYRFKEDFCKELKIPGNQYDRKQKELLDWLTNFFDFEFYKGRPIRIFIKEIYGEYQPLPHKVPKQEILTEEKLKDYETYTIAALGSTFKPNSKMKIARDAIDDFGKKKYHHTSAEAVSKRFIKKPFDEFGETNGKWCWVWYSNYKALDQEAEECWRKLLWEEEIAEDEASNAFYKLAEGEDISFELNKYQRAKNRIIEKYDDFPVRVREWKVKTKSES